MLPGLVRKGDASALPVITSGLALTTCRKSQSAPQQTAGKEGSPEAEVKGPFAPRSGWENCTCTAASLASEDEVVVTLAQTAACRGPALPTCLRGALGSLQVNFLFGLGKYSPSTDRGQIFSPAGGLVRKMMFYKNLKRS